ncbi:MAG: RHS repeat-associated core domain-containing protein [Dokdonella sp.]
MKQGGSTIASFQYDPLGRRISKTIGGTVTTFLYDGQNSVQETRAPAIGAATLSSILSGLGIDERYEQTDGASKEYFLTDALGSTVALTDASGSVQQTYAYEPYGEVSATGASTNPYQYTGRENDGTGLYYYRARYYSPNLKRFISEDPMGLSAGLNEYAYVRGNPLSFIDPFGLSEQNTVTRSNGTLVIKTGGDYSGDTSGVSQCLQAHEQCHSDDMCKLPQVQQICSDPKNDGHLIHFDVTPAQHQQFETHGMQCEIDCLITIPGRCKDRVLEQVKKEQAACAANESACTLAH